MAYNWNQVIQALSDAEPQIDFHPGLTDVEIQRVETVHRFQFPEDLRSFLQSALPHGDRFPDWRSGNTDELKDWLDRPRRGIAFDVEHNNFWLPEWGPRPTTLEISLHKSNELVRNAPKLIPIYAHRMMPTEPTSAGNPVYSVHQTDIIYYGFDLLDYFCQEFKIPRLEEPPEETRDIRFWDIDRFQEVRWADGPNIFDCREGPQE